MSVLIKGMDLPKSCATCKLICQDTAYKISTFEQVITYFCKGLDENNVIQNTLIKLPNCPLVEIPTPHGRLIDADRLYETIEQMEGFGTIDNENDVVLSAVEVLTEIDEAKTIIEAEE